VQHVSAWNPGQHNSPTRRQSRQHNTEGCEEKKENEGLQILEHEGITIMKVVLYARVSKDENADDNRFQNPENQLRVMRDFCKAKGWEVIKEYVDRCTGADPSRPEFRKMLKEPWILGYRAVVVWKLDRFSREPLSVVLGYINNLKRQNIALISVTESWLDTREENPVSELVLAIMAWAAAEERRKISERTKAGIRRLKAIGQWKGGRPRKVGL
jgi:DNA invertase Pin-like site-specific DNA recombinase